MNYLWMVQLLQSEYELSKVHFAYLVKYGELVQFSIAGFILLNALDLHRWVPGRYIFITV